MLEVVDIKFNKGEKVKFILNDCIKKGEIVGHKGVIFKKYSIAYIDCYFREVKLVKNKDIIKLTDVDEYRRKAV